MGTARIPLSPLTAIPATSNGARLKVVAGTNFPFPVLMFAATPDQQCYWVFRVPDYASGNLTLSLFWYADTASANNVVWEAQIAAITPNTDTQDVETKAFATLNYVQDTHLGTTNQRLHECSITISNLDSLAAGDWVALRLARDANDTNATDDMTGDAYLVDAELSYTT